MHYVLTIGSDLKDGNGFFIEEMKQRKEYKSTNDRSLSKIGDGDTLYVSAHGVWDPDTGRSERLIEKFKDRLDAKKAYDWLVKKNLPNARFKLKIFACFSAGAATPEGMLQEDLASTFAGKLSLMMRGSHSLVTVYGYLNELKLSTLGPDKHKLGGALPDNEGLARRAKDARVEFPAGGGTPIVRWDVAASDD